MVDLLNRDPDRIRTCDLLLRRQLLYPAELRGLLVSGWQDSNLRSPGPKPGAITGLRYTPNISNKQYFQLCGEGGIRTPGTVTGTAV
jgi:hypothetical protein